MRASPLLICLFGGASALAQPESYGPWPRLGISDPPAPQGAVAHRLSPARDGLILSNLQGGKRDIELCWVRLDADGWGEPRVAAADPKMLANWADVPAVVEGGDGAMYAHWLLPTVNTAEAYDIRVLRSTDAGETWTDLGTLHDDGLAVEHGFVSYVPDPGGVRAYWLDGREITHNEIGMAQGFMTLRTAVVGDSIGESVVIDDKVCDCCTTGAALTDAGPLVVYRDRTEAEVRDIAIAGAAAGDPRVLADDGWVIPGCPVNGPAIDARGSTVAVAWFTGAENKVRVQAMLSTDGGATFGPPVVIDQARGTDTPLGRVDVVLDGEEAIVSWLATEQREGVIKLQRFGTAGPIGAPRNLAPMSAERGSGFPQMERLGEHVVVVWRDPEGKILRAAALGLEYIGR